MDYTKIFKKLLKKYFTYTATIYIQSNPILVMEVLLLLVGFLLLVLQHLQITKISRKCMRLKPHMIYYKMDTELHGKVLYPSGIRKTRKHNPTTMVYERPIPSDSSKSQLGWVLNEASDKNSWADHLLSITPQQYVKMEKERKQRERECNCSTNSLSTLCQVVVRKQWSNETLKKKLATVRENLECNTTSLESTDMGYKIGEMSESLVSMLEKLIINSSVENPLPFKGDITTLAADAAALLTDENIQNNNATFNIIEHLQPLTPISEAAQILSDELSK